MLQAFISLAGNCELGEANQKKNMENWKNRDTVFRLSKKVNNKYHHNVLFHDTILWDFPMFFFLIIL